MAKPQQRPAQQGAPAPQPHPVAEVASKPAETRPADGKATAQERPANPSAPPTATTDHPWRHLHPVRVWPD